MESASPKRSEWSDKKILSSILVSTKSKDGKEIAFFFFNVLLALHRIHLIKLEKTYQKYF